MEPRTIPRAAVLLFVAALAFAQQLRPPETPYTTHQQTQEWLIEHRAAYESAIAKARRWLAPLEIKPEALRANEIMPKKKLVELIDVWARLYRIAEPRDKPHLLARIDVIADVTRAESYHDMRITDDVTFKREATSYLRAAYLLDKLGLDVSRYRKEIAAIRPRLDGHMHKRGPSQRYMFGVYYAHFGLPPHPLLTDPLEEGLIAKRAPASGMNKDESYFLTHEIFGPFDYGDRLDVQPYSADELRYLRGTLSELLQMWMQRGNTDLVAEIVSCLRYIRAVDLPAYTSGLDYLLQTQERDGRWGDYAPEAEKIGQWATTYKLELHTTAVAVDALTIAFHPDFNRAVEPLEP